MGKFQVLKEYSVLIELCSSLCRRFISSTKKAFMGPSSSLTLQMHRAFNSMCDKELLNLENFMFSSQTVNRKYTLCRILSTGASSSQVHRCSTIL